MKSLLLLCLLSIQTASAQKPWWGACKKVCWAEYQSCESEVRRVWDPLIADADGAEASLLESNRKFASKTCVTVRKDCFKDCNSQKRGTEPRDR